MGKLYTMAQMANNKLYYITDFDTSPLGKCASNDVVTVYTSASTGNGYCYSYTAATGGSQVVIYKLFKKGSIIIQNFKFSNVNIFLGKSSNGKVLLNTLSTSLSGMGYSPQILTDNTGINNWLDTLVIVTKLLR